jgi:type II secretory pathway predicted ATPase ExeA
MYSRFYGFAKEPFQATPDTDFLFLSPSHKEALACLEYGIRQRKGFLALIGEVGVGKTMMIRSYLQKVDVARQKTIYILDPKVSFDSLLSTILKELEIEPVGQASENVCQLQEALLREYRNERVVVLIIDEAQNMPVETLESIRMLSNLETSTEKLIQIVLVGQPEFNVLLKRYDLRQVNERIALRVQIASLSKDESLAYIEHRIRNVSRENKSVFSKQALHLIAKAAKGIPRQLNILCDNALITGFGYQQPLISYKIAKEVIADHNGRHRQTGWTLRRRDAVVMLSVALPLALYLVHLLEISTPTAINPLSSDGNGRPVPVVKASMLPIDASPESKNTQSLLSIRRVAVSDSKIESDLPPADRMELSETARLLAVLLDCGRVVVGRAQVAINNPRVEDKGFSSTVFEGQLRKEFLARTRHDLHNLAAAPMPERAKPLLLRLSFFMQKAVHEVQPDINKKGIGFKGFIPATFGTQVAAHFTKDTGLKLRQIGPPQTPPRNPNNKPDDQEEELLHAIKINHPRVGDHVVVQQLSDNGGVRVLLPLFYSKQCLVCHGGPKGDVDISGYEKEGFRDGDLGGAISIVVPTQNKIARGNE